MIYDETDYVRELKRLARACSARRTTDPRLRAANEANKPHGTVFIAGCDHAFGFYTLFVVFSAKAQTRYATNPQSW